MTVAKENQMKIRDVQLLAKYDITMREKTFYLSLYIYMYINIFRLAPC